ncbi:sensor histidine kinase [Lactobacillus intestinalis]|uniref:sensor histidine kinase n=1 Tax=Lactobacillus intestinalis TaxID=151781 RepID=UPI00070C1E42|nr:GHKL domain-containing protein [Lactobacillus intestinalis]UTW40066.1 GHKL domain-containing protein [Lactobacillus intestinalis]
MLLAIINIFFIGPAVDILIFLNITKLRVKSIFDRFVLIGLGITVILLESISDFIKLDQTDLIFTIIEASLFEIVFYKRVKDKILLVNAGIIVAMLSLISDFVITISENLSFTNTALVEFMSMLLPIIEYIVIRHYSSKLNRLFSGINKKTIFYTLLYLYISTAIAYIVATLEKQVTIETLTILGILVIQGVYAIVSLKLNLQLQTTLLEKAEQQKLKDVNHQLEKNNKQLKDYATSLEKDEDRLRRFKHDYRNILNGLKIAAQKDDSKALIKQLDEYSQNHFDENTLSKFKDVHHIHNDMIKSIIITKLAKIYDDKIPYRFSCEKDIIDFPFISKDEELDIVRIIGIAFDNAIEASEGLKNAQIEAMLYQSEGNLEFIIRNKIDQVDKDQILKAGFTTKNDHNGLGLSNAMEIANKYFENIMVDVDTKGEWFTFSLVLLPTN